MFGVYFINSGDDRWTKVEAMPTLEEATNLMIAFRDLMINKFKKPPYCMAVSKGHDEDFVPRGELSAVTGRHL